MSDTADEAEPTDGDLAAMVAQFDELAATVDTDAEREQVRAAREEALEAVEAERVFGKTIRGFDRGDAAEVLVGSVLFGLPMFVEDGTRDVGVFLAAHPAALLATVAFGVAMVVGILYVAEIQDVRVHEPYLGVVPRRLAGVVAIAGVTALVMMTLWGRVDWTAPVLDLARVTVAAVPMAIGGALGDILPGS